MFPILFFVLNTTKIPVGAVDGNARRVSFYTKLGLGKILIACIVRLRRSSAAARLLRLWVRILPGAWMFVVNIVLLGRGLCDDPITRPE